MEFVRLAQLKIVLSAMLMSLNVLRVPLTWFCRATLNAKPPAMILSGKTLTMSANNAFQEAARPALPIKNNARNAFLLMCFNLRHCVRLLAMTDIEIITTNAINALLKIVKFVKMI